MERVHRGADEIPLWPDVIDAVKSSFAAFDSCVARMDVQRVEQASSSGGSRTAGYQFMVEFPGVAKHNVKVLHGCMESEPDPGRWR
jgi:hypothetical protein